jgi:hypothetical protein
MASYGSEHVTCPVPGNFNLIETTAMTLGSLPIILLLTSTLVLTRTRVQPYLINYNTYPCTAERRHTRPYTIIGLSGIGYVSLTRFREFTPIFDVSHHVIKQVKYCQLTPMPPKKTARTQLRMANTRESTHSLASQITPIPSGRVSVLPEDEITDEDQDHRIVQIDEKEGDDDNEDEHQDRGYIRAAFTDEDVWEMIEQQRKLVNTVMQQNEELMEVNRELRQGSAQPESTTKSEKFKLTQPKRFCGAAQELEIFICALRANFRTHSQLFPNGDSDKVQHALDHLRSLANHSDQSQQKTSMTDPVSWGQELRNQENLCLEDIDLSSTELRKMYGEKEWELNAAPRAYHQFPQGYHDPKEGVMAYSNRLRRK